MIRKLQEPDVDRVMALWLGANLKAHDFVPTAYWRNNFESVKEMLPQAEVYVYEEAGAIQGFVGLSGGYIEGIFVSGEMQSQGIGKRLLDHIWLSYESHKRHAVPERIPEEHTGNSFLPEGRLRDPVRGLG